MPRFRAILIVTIFALSITLVHAGDKRPTGITHGNLYADAATGFVFQKYDNWKFGKIGAEDPAMPRPTRLMITQQGFQVPVEYLENEDKFNPPMLGVWADTSTMVLEAIAAELGDRKSKRLTRKDLIKDFPMLGNGQFIEAGTTTIDGQKAIVQHYRKEYEVQLYNRVKDLYKLKEDVILGDLYIVRHGGHVYAFHFTCERALYRTVNEEIKGILAGIDFDPPADSSKGATPASPGE